MNNDQDQTMLTNHIRNEVDNFIENNTSLGFDDLDDISKQQYIILNNIQNKIGEFLSEDEACLLLKYLPQLNRKKVGV